MAADLFVVPMVTFRLLFVLVILAHERRRIVHVAVTEHPTATWTAQQLRNAFPDHEAPEYLLHDRDAVFADIATTIAGMDIQAVRTAPRAPWQNAYVERVIGSIRRECLDHVIVMDAAGLHRVLRDYLAYYAVANTSATRQGRAHHATRYAAVVRIHVRDSTSRWSPPPLRPDRSVTFDRHPTSRAAALAVPRSGRWRSPKGAVIGAPG